MTKPLCKCYNDLKMNHGLVINLMFIDRDQVIGPYSYHSTVKIEHNAINTLSIQSTLQRSTYCNYLDFAWKNIGNSHLLENILLGSGIYVVTI